jgi:hypothetical protein
LFTTGDGWEAVGVVVPVVVVPVVVVPPDWVVVVPLVVEVVEPEEELF